MCMSHMNLIVSSLVVILVCKVSVAVLRRFWHNSTEDSLSSFLHPPAREKINIKGNLTYPLLNRRRLYTHAMNLCGGTSALCKNIYAVT